MAVTHANVVPQTSTSLKSDPCVRPSNGSCKVRMHVGSCTSAGWCGTLWPGALLAWGGDRAWWYSTNAASTSIVNGLRPLLRRMDGNRARPRFGPYVVETPAGGGGIDIRAGPIVCRGQARLTFQKIFHAAGRAHGVREIIKDMTAIRPSSR